MIALIIFTIGIVCFIVAYGIKDSISAYYYAMPTTWNFLFSLWLASIGIIIFKGTETITVELAASTLIGVACCEAYKENKYVHFAHFFCAYSAALLALIAIFAFDFTTGLIFFVIILSSSDNVLLQETILITAICLIM
jgi:hypothetical protein